MATITVTADNHDATITSKDIVILDFWAEWCGPCKMFGPIFEAASEKHEDIAFGKVDTDAEQKLAGGYGIRSIPSVVVYRGGIPIHMQPGALRPADLENLIEQVRNLNMDEVKAEIAKREAAQG